MKNIVIIIAVMLMVSCNYGKIINRHIYAKYDSIGFGKYVNKKMFDVRKKVINNIIINKNDTLYFFESYSNQTSCIYGTLITPDTAVTYFNCSSSNEITIDPYPQDAEFGKQTINKFIKNDYTFIDSIRNLEKLGTGNSRINAIKIYPNCNNNVYLCW